MKPATDNSYGATSEHWLDIGFATLLQFPGATVTKNHEPGGLKPIQTKPK